MKLQEYFLLPGPTDVPSEVLSAMSTPMINHRGPEFKELLNDITEKTKKVFKTKNDLFILTTSGTGGLEASVVNFISPGEKVIVASIGNFGERYRDIAITYGLDVDFIDFGWGNTIDPQVIADRLAADKNQEIRAIFCQHNETSTAIVNPIEAIAKAKGDHPALLIVDTVSGLGAAPFDVDGWNIDVAVAGSQKAFMAPPGLAFISVSPRAMERMETCTNQRFYFDLRAAKKSLEKGQTPFTPAVSVFYAVAKALVYFEEVGVDQVVADHYQNRDLIRAGLKGLGLRLLADDDIASPAVTAIYCPEGIHPKTLQSLLFEKYNIVIAGGQGKFIDSVFRIGHLGAIRKMDMIVAMSGLEMALTEMGLDISLGSGVRAMEETILNDQITSV